MFTLSTVPDAGLRVDHWTYGGQTITDSSGKTQHRKQRYHQNSVQNLQRFR